MIDNEDDGGDDGDQTTSHYVGEEDPAGTGDARGCSQQSGSNG